MKHEILHVGATLQRYEDSVARYAVVVASPIPFWRIILRKIFRVG
jgi:hypothetical protein